jgi:hypothetical protein
MPVLRACYPRIQAAQTGKNILMAHTCLVRNCAPHPVGKSREEYPVPYHFPFEEEAEEHRARNKPNAFLEAIELHIANNQGRIYGEVLDLVSAPASVSETLVFVDALNRKSGQVGRVRIPPTIVQTARIRLSQSRRTAQPDYRLNITVTLVH